MEIGKIVIEEYPNRYWSVAEVFKNGKHIKTLNKFYTVDANWINIYDEVGGSGIGFKRGDLKDKIFIGDCELERKKVNDTTGTKVFSW